MDRLIYAHEIEDDDEEQPWYSEASFKKRKTDDRENSNGSVESRRELATLQPVHEEKHMKIKKKRTYRRVEEKLRVLALEPQTFYDKTKAPDLRVQTSGMKEEVYVDGPAETVDIWAARQKKLTDDWLADPDNSRADADIYFMNYIICSEEREMCDLDFKNHALIKWEGFPVPTWEPFKNKHIIPRENLKGVAVDDFKLRCLLLDFVEYEMRSMNGQEYFSDNFPYRYLEWEKGRGDGGYVEDERAHYKNKLRAIEDFLNSLNRQSHRPPILVEDWSNKAHADDILDAFEYSVIGEPVDDSAVVLMNSSEFERGRQKPLLLFREQSLRDEWCIRALTEFAENKFIAEYRSNQHTEMHFIAHSCEPNLYYKSSIIQRNGFEGMIGAFHAKRDIIRGEKLTVDKAQGRELEELNGVLRDLILTNGCGCGSLCRFTNERIEEYKRKHRV